MCKRRRLVIPRPFCKTAFALLALAAATPLSAQCRERTRNAIHELYPKASSLVFFSSWCFACKEHLISHRADAEGTLFVVFHDTPERAWEALQAAGLPKDVRCIADPDGEWARQAEIRSIPATAAFSP